ncbi:ABC transporter substrate-binding protein [Terrilactibacillus laevilacticus]|uniref:ABC transporter substrate-binding protein n=1 Tax=Terrilactibacillus laevilacticus TaxID=1380157 RepID=A0ABW5PMJ3_9BACI|nr:extracellular solute-binding protein [Terrilactibacillus laevilacticus]
MGRKILSIVGIILLVISSLAACSGNSSSKDDENTVTIWSWRSQDAKIWKKVEDQLNKDGKNIKISFRTFTPTQYDASLQTAMNGGKGPDILTLRGGSGIAKYATGKQITSLDNKVPGLDNFSKGVMSQVKTDGKTYAVPFAVQTSQFFYNKDLFKKYNLQVPKTWDDLINNMKVLKEKNVTPMGISGREGWALALILDSVGASQLGDPWVKDLISGKTHFNDPKFVNVLSNINSLKKYFQNGYSASSYQDMETLFSQGKVAMIVDGIWSVKTIQDQNPNLKIGSFLAPPVDTNQKARVYAFVDGGYGLNAKSKTKKAAIDVLKYTSTKQYAQTYTDLFGEIPGYPGIAPTNGTPLLNVAMNNYKENSINQLFRIRSPFSYGDPAIDTLAASGLQELFAGKKTPQTLADQLQKSITKWYKPFK